MLSFVNHDQKYLFGSFAVSKSSCVDTCPESRFNLETLSFHFGLLLSRPKELERHQLTPSLEHLL